MSDGQHDKPAAAASRPSPTRASVLDRRRRTPRRRPARSDGRDTGHEVARQAPPARSTAHQPTATATVAIEPAARWPARARRRRTRLRARSGRNGHSAARPSAAASRWRRSRAPRRRRPVRLGIGERPRRQERGEARPWPTAWRCAAAPVRGCRRPSADRWRTSPAGRAPRPRRAGRASTGGTPGTAGRRHDRRTRVASRPRCGRRPESTAGGGAATAPAAAPHDVPPQLVPLGGRRPLGQPASSSSTKAVSDGLADCRHSCRSLGRGPGRAEVEPFEQRLGQPAGGVGPPPRPVVDPPVRLEERGEVADARCRPACRRRRCGRPRAADGPRASGNRAAPRPAASVPRRRSPSASTAAGSAAWSPASTRRGGPSPSGRRRRPGQHPVRPGQRVVGQVDDQGPQVGQRRGDGRHARRRAHVDDRQVARRARPAPDTMSSGGGRRTASRSASSPANRRRSTSARRA